MENDRLNEIRELNPDYDISMHELDVCVGHNSYMTNEQLNQYYSKDADKKQCWVSKDHNCPLKEQCNGLVKPECKEHISNEEACHAIDKMIEWYYQVEEPEFLKFYNCHLEMLE